MLLKQQKNFQAKNPSVPFHQVIDIVRDLADKEYLECIKFSGQVQYIYLDRNNTPDIWQDLSSHIHQNNGRQVYLVPQQPENEGYATPNPISPYLFYHCAKRIFSRTSHECLSGADKPKVVEVLLKFTKLYDNTDFTQIKSEVQHLDYGITKNIVDETKEVITWAINSSPDGFRVPSEKIIKEVIRHCERQIIKDQEADVVDTMINYQVKNQSLIEQTLAFTTAIEPKKKSVAVISSQQ